MIYDSHTQGDAGTHRRGQTYLLYVGALCRDGLNLLDMRNKRLDVLDEFFRREALLANNSMDIAARVISELDFTGGKLRDRCDDIGSHSAILG